MKLRHLIFGIYSIALPATAADITWNKSGADDLWNTSSLNWTGGATFFTTGDNVTFDNATGETVTVDAGGVSAGTIAVGANNGSWIFSGGSITSSGALTKNGTGTLTLSSANSFNSVAINGGPNSDTTGAVAVGIAGALGTGTITLGNTGTMTALFFQSGFGSNTLSNNITFASGAVRTNLLATAGISQVVTLDGLLSGGNSGATIYLNNNIGGGVAKFRVTNTSNSVLGTWRLNRGALEITSDAALGNSANDITLDVTGTNAGTGLTFGANNITLNSGRSVTVLTETIIDTATFTGSQINGAVTFTGQMVKKGSTILTLNAAGSGAGGVRIDAGSISIGNAAALGTGAITFNTTDNAMLRTNALGGAVTLANNIVLNNPAAAGNLGILIKAGSGNSLQINGVISGGGANTTLFLDTDTGGDVTGKFILNNANTYGGKTYINRGSVQLNNAAGFGTSAVQFDSSPNAVLGFNGPMTVANDISYTYGAKKIDTGANDVTLSGVQDLLASISKEGSGKLTLTNTNTGTSAMTVNQGTLSLASSATLASATVTVKSGATLSGRGTLSGNVTVESNGIHAVGDALGVQTVGGTATYQSGSIFSWDLASSKDGDSLDSGDTGVRGTDYDGLTANTISVTDAAFRVVLGSSVVTAIQGGDSFWTTTQKWSDIFSGSFSGSFKSLVQIYDSTNTDITTSLAAYGGFTTSSGTLTWTAVPEPNSTLAGLLITAGILRRRRQ